MDLDSLTDMLLPDENKPNGLRRWRLKHAGLNLTNTAILFLIVLPALFGIAYALPRLGTVAWANDVDRRIDEKVAAAVKPLKETQDAQGAKLDAAVALLEAQQVNDLQRSILLAKKEQCAAVRDGRGASYWTGELSRLRQVYRTLTKYEADIPTDCAAL